MGLVFVLEKVPTQAAPLPEPAVEEGAEEEKDDCMEAQWKVFPQKWCSENDAAAAAHNIMHTKL